MAFIKMFILSRSSEFWRLKPMHTEENYGKTYIQNLDTLFTQMQDEVFPLNLALKYMK
jgi:hypothetical protein